MTKEEAINLVLNGSQMVQMDTEFAVEVIDEVTGQVEETIVMPPGNYMVYQNYDLESVGEIRKFIEDPQTCFNRLLRLANQE